jgi:hypothetical protein
VRAQVVNMGLLTVVVVFGMSGHGKDTLADMIAQEIGTSRVLRCAFADPLKSAAQHLVGMPREVAYGNQQIKATWRVYGKTARQWLQIIGTEIGRIMIDPNVWVDRLADVVLSQPDQIVVAIVSDGRFWNELSGLRSRLPGVDVRNVMVHRSGVPLLGRPPTFVWRAASFLTGLPGVRHLLRAFGSGPVSVLHQSEAELWEMQRIYDSGDKGLFDEYVANDGTLEHLRAHAKRIVDAIVLPSRDST